jgi:UDP-N-acetylmuramoyl-L-alanyl-D-glutamate--2,6-diaminopimelate ligase
VPKGVIMGCMNPKKMARKIVPKKAVKALEKGYRRSRGQMWQARYGYPARGLKMIAVTGTNGKTTTASYVNSVLKAAGLKTAVYTTAYYEIDGERVPNESHMTVASQRSVQEFFANAKRAGVDWVILEVTSHALHQGRIAGLKPEIGIVTNLTQEHLDYHGTMEEYARAKAMLFTKYGARTAILNHDDKWHGFFSDKIKQKQISFGENSSSGLVLKNINIGEKGSKFDVVIDGQKLPFTTKLLGKFNIYNALCAIAVGQEIGLKPAKIQDGIASLESVPGRMEEIDEGQNFTVVVDFAITPDALENVLTTLRATTKGKLAIVFGATGDRDPTKRGPMGEVVADLADRIYLTDDETYTEDPKSIRDAVYQGIAAKNARSKTQVFDDRLEAIKQSFADAKRGDTVLLTGIGHENYRNMGGKKLPWDERQVARQELKSFFKQK